MSYLDDFEHSFMQHTLEIVREYKGPYDATLFINCLLGLLVVPRDSFLEAIPEEPLSELKSWGIDPASIQSPGNSADSGTLRGLVRNLRNAVAHFNLTPIPKTSAVHSFAFTDRNGLRAVIKLNEMRVFVERLAEYLDAH